MKVLMFGWEFPPKIYGGLAVATYGITKGLSIQGDVETTFCMPKPCGDEEKFLGVVEDAGRHVGVQAKGRPFAATAYACGNAINGKSDKQDRQGEHDVEFGSHDILPLRVRMVQK